MDPRPHRRDISMGHHHRYPLRGPCQQRDFEPGRYRVVPYPDRHSAGMVTDTVLWNAGSPRNASLSDQERPG